MAEFVESSLEELVPLFEQLQNVELLKQQEVAGLVKQCRRYEYRLQKRQKTPKDFVSYAEYLNEVLILVRSRRARLNYWKKMKIIDRALQQKVISLWSRCCNRFMGDLALWRRQIAVLDEYRHYKQLSKTYVRLLQVHGANPELRIEAAKWEFFTNASADNARTILQYALRAHPEDSRLYSALFHIEIGFVDRVMKRREFLQKSVEALNKKLRQKKAEKGEEQDSDSEIDESVFDQHVEDAVIKMEVARLVVSMGLQKVNEKDRGAMLLDMWKLLGTLSSLPKEHLLSLQKYIEDELNSLDNEDTVLLHVAQTDKDGGDMYDAYDMAIKQKPTENMYRKYIEFCDSRDANVDTFAEMKKNILLKELVECGWARDDELLEVVINSDDVHESPAEKLKLLETALSKNRSSVVCWSEYLRLKMSIDSETFGDATGLGKFLAKLNEAFEKVPAADNYPIWELALEFAINHTPDNVEKVFNQALLNADRNVVSKIKILRLNYIIALVKEDKIIDTKTNLMIEELIKRKPNTNEFYLAVVEQYLDMKEAQHLVKMALNAAITENGKDSIDGWLKYGSYAMSHDPMLVASVHSRALLTLDAEKCEEFVIEWTKMQQNASSKVFSGVICPLAKKKSKNTENKEVHRQEETSSDDKQIETIVEDRCTTPPPKSVTEKIPASPARTRRQKALQTTNPELFADD